MPNFLTHNFYNDSDRWVLWIPVLIGIGVGIYFGLTFEPTLLVSCVILLCVLSSFYWPCFRFISWIVLFISLGFLASQLRTMTLSTYMLDKPLGPLVLNGEIDKVELKYTKNNKAMYQIILRLNQKRGDDARLKLINKIRLTIRGYPGRLYYHDKIRLKAKLLPIHRLTTPSGFDFQRHLYFQGVGATGIALSHPAIVNRSPLISWDLFLEKVRNFLAYSFRSNLSKEEGSIAIALVTGDRGSISESLKERFNASGLAHILAISGLHLSLIAGFVFIITRRALSLIVLLSLKCPIHKYAAIISISIAFLYLSVAGFGVPAKRAFVMTVLVMGAVLFDRVPLSMRAVACAATVILLLTPETLLSPSFQMSFSAVIILIASYEKWKNPFLQNKDKTIVQWCILYVGGVGFTSFLATIATLPLTLYHFQRMAILGIFANLLAVPLTAIIILPSAFFSCCLLPFDGAEFPLFMLEKGISFLIAIANFFSDSCFAVIKYPKLSFCSLLAIIGGGLWVSLWQQTWRYLGFIGIGLGIFFSMLNKRPDIFIDSEAKVVGFIKENTLFLTTLKKGKFSINTWLSESGISIIQKIDCKEGGYNFKLKDYSIYIKTKEDGKCPQADVLISLARITTKCTSRHLLIIDKENISINGAYALFLKSDGVDFKTGRQAQGQRPWSINSSLVRK